MSPYRRNVMVGLTTLVALIGLGWMTLKFGGDAMAPFQPKRVEVRFVGPRADGLSEGSAVLYRGKQVGQVTAVRLESDLRSVVVFAQVEPPLPGELVGSIRITSAIGSSSAIVLADKGDLPSGEIRSGQEITIKFVGLDLIPPEIAELAAELKLATREFRDTKLLQHIDEQVKKAGDTIEAIRKVVDDPKLQDDVRVSLSNIRAASENANQLTAKLDTLTEETTTTIKTSREKIEQVSKQMDERMAQVATLLDQANGITTKINQGQGTAGKLVNDAKLYESLVDTTAQLNLTIKDLQRLVQQWEQEGISFKLK